MQHRFKVNRRFFVVLGILLLVFVVGIVPAFASGPTLPEIDLTPIFDSLALYLPWVFAILAVPTGLVLAFMLAQFVINAFKKAFGSGGMR